MILVVAAVGIGSCAFETGNISGAAMGLQSLFGIDNRLCIIITAVLAGILLWTGSYKVVERTLHGSSNYDLYFLGYCGSYTALNL